MNRTIFTIAWTLCTTLAIAQNIESKTLKQHVYILAHDSLMGRGFGLQGGRMAADYIEEQFAQAGIAPWNGKYRHPFISGRLSSSREGTNIIGWVEGTDPLLKDEYIVVGGHYDHLGYIMKDNEPIIYNGADDNASGTATVIELGRWLVINRHLLKRSVILIAFDGEESGLIGSSHIVRKNIIPINRVKAMFALDMVGMLSKYGGIDLVGNKTIKGGKETFEQLALKHNIKIKKDGNRIVRNTDTSPFGQRGVPSIHVFTSTVSPYHKPEDEAHLLDYEGMACIANFLTDAIVELSTQEVIESTLKLKSTKNDHRVSIGILLGGGPAYHIYKDDYFNGKDIFAFSGGLFTKVKLTNKMDIVPEVLYQSLGSKHNDGTLRTHQVTIPLNLRLNLLPSDTYSDNFYFLVGPYYSYRFHGKLGGTSMDFDNIFNRDDIGLQYGFGVDFFGIKFQFCTSISYKSIHRTENILQQNIMFNWEMTF